MKKVKQKEEIYKIKEKVLFEFAYEENAKNVALALSFAGYYVRVFKSNRTYCVGVYTHN